MDQNDFLYLLCQLDAYALGTKVLQYSEFLWFPPCIFFLFLLISSFLCSVFLLNFFFQISLLF